MGDGPAVKPAATPFRMPIDSARTITGRGTAVAGTVQQGSVRKDDPVEIVGGGAPSRSSVVTTVLKAGKVVARAQTGEAVELLLRGVPATDIGRSSVVQGR